VVSAVLETETSAVVDCLYWIGQTKQRGRGVFVQTGLQQQRVSTPDVDRILNADSLATVNAYGINLDGHPCYVLTLENTGITMVYDTESHTWCQWTSLTLGTPVNVSTITRAGQVATVTTAAPHGLNDGEPVTIAGANQSQYNGIFQISNISTTQFSYVVTGSPATPATGTITSTGYTETYFKFTKYADCAGVANLLHETDGNLYAMNSALYQDAGIPIDCFIRTSRIDTGSTERKSCPNLMLIGTKISATAALRWSDDDSTTFTKYRSVDLSQPRPMLRRNGAFRRRSFEVKYVANAPLILEALEIGE